MKVVRIAWSDVEAAILKGVLQDAGVPVVLRGHETDVLGQYAAGMGMGIAGGLPQFPGGELLVPDDRADEARDLITGYLASLKDETGP